MVRQGGRGFSWFFSVNPSKFRDSPPLVYNCLLSLPTRSTHHSPTHCNVNMVTFSSRALTALLTLRPHTGYFAINPVYVDVASKAVTDLDKGDIVCVNWRKQAPYSVKLTMRKPTELRFLVTALRQNAHIASRKIPSER